MILIHPGTPLEEGRRQNPVGVSLISFNILELLRLAMERTDLKNKYVYVIDNTPSTPEASRFLAAATLKEVGGRINVTSLSEEAIDEFRSVGDSKIRRASSFHQKRDIQLGSRDLRLYFVTTDNGYDPSITYVVLGGVLIFIACALLAACMQTRM